MQIEHPTTQKTPAEKLAILAAKRRETMAESAAVEAAIKAAIEARNDAKLNNVIDPSPDAQALADKAQHNLDMLTAKEHQLIMDLSLFDDSIKTLSAFTANERQKQHQQSVQHRHDNALAAEAETILALQAAVGTLRAIGKIKNNIFPDILGLVQTHCRESELNYHTDAAMAKLAKPIQH